MSILHKQNRIILRMSGAMFCAYLTLGFSLGVIPVFVHQQLQLNDMYVGLAVGLQFLTTLISRPYAGRWADKKGARGATFIGFALCSASGIGLLICYDKMTLDTHSLFMLILSSRVILGIGESFLLTGNLTWATYLAGANRVGTVISWNGMATYGALAAGAPLGLLVYETAGIGAAGGLTLLLPLLAWLLDAGLPAIPRALGQRLPLSGIIAFIWRPGVGLLLQGIGFAVLSTFTLLFFREQEWSLAGFSLTAFGCAFILVRLLFGHLPDRSDCLRVARVSLFIEAVGLLLIAISPHPMFALLGAALTGCGCSLIFPALGVYLVRLVPENVRGTALGGYSAFQDLAYGLTGPLAGLLAIYGGYRSLFLFASGTALLGILLLTLLINPSSSHQRT